MQISVSVKIAEDVVYIVFVITAVIGQFVELCLPHVVSAKLIFNLAFYNDQSCCLQSQARSDISPDKGHRRLCIPSLLRQRRHVLDERSVCSICLTHDNLTSR